MAEEYKVIKGFDTAEGEARYDYEFLLNKPDIIGQIRAELEEYVPPVDNSLTNEGAAADAKATGEAIQNAIQEAKNYTDQKEIEVDKTLKLEGKAAEAAATGDAIKAAKNEAIEEAEQRTQELLGEYVPDLEDVVYSGNDDDDIPTIEQETIYATHLGVNPAEDFALKGYVNALGANLQDKFNNYYTIEQIGKSYLTAGQVKQDYLTIEGAKDIYTTPEAVNLIVDKRIEKLSEGEIVLEGLATTEQLNEVKNSKAPAGYGLGGTNISTEASRDANELKDIGWYVSNLNTPNNEWWYVHVTANYSNAVIIQEAWYYLGTTTAPYAAIKATRTWTNIDSRWSEWEYFNPPMIEGEEYRTTERWNGKPVYTKLKKIGTTEATKFMHFSISNIGELIRITPNLDGLVCTEWNVSGTDASANNTFRFFPERVSVGVDIYVVCGSNRVGKTLYVQAWYTKTT